MCLSSLKSWWYWARSRIKGLHCNVWVKASMRNSWIQHCFRHVLIPIHCTFQRCRALNIKRCATDFLCASISLTDLKLFYESLTGICTVLWILCIGNQSTCTWFSARTTMPVKLNVQQINKNLSLSRSNFILDLLVKNRILKRYWSIVISLSSRQE